MEPDDAPVDGFQLGLEDAMKTGWFNRETGEVASGFPVGAEDVVADIGCGDGASIDFCASRGAHVILADVDAGRLGSVLARLGASSARKVEAHITNSNPLPLQDGCASRIICTEVLEHVDDPSAVMAELVRIGQPGALYLLSVPGHVSEHMQKHLAAPEYFERPNHIRIFEPAAFAALVEGGGLQIERRYVYSFFWAMWWTMFWQTEASFETAADHPLLASWARTWSLVLKGRDGAKIQALMNELMPKSQVIIARKPA